MTTIRVVACVLERTGRFLVCQRPARKHHGGLWEFPGGKLEASETIAAAAKRELQEELDVEVTQVGPEEFVHHDPVRSLELVFVPVQFTGEPQNLEHDEIRWCTVEEMLALPLAPADLLFARRLSAR